MTPVILLYAKPIPWPPIESENVPTPRELAAPAVVSIMPNVLERPSKAYKETAPTTFEIDNTVVARTIRNAVYPRSGLSMSLSPPIKALSVSTA